MESKLSIIGGRGHAQVWKIGAELRENQASWAAEFRKAQKGRKSRRTLEQRKREDKSFELKWWSPRSQEEMEAYFGRNNNNKLIIWRILPFRPLFTCYGAKNIGRCGVGCS